MMKVKHMQKLLGRKEKMILEALEKAGYEAYFVGGCVRDALMGRESGDADVPTDALPQQVKETFTGFNVIATGIKHGTVTVILPGEGVATVPASNRVSVPVPTIPAAIMPRMVTGLDST